MVSPISLRALILVATIGMCVLLFGRFHTTRAKGKEPRQVSVRQAAQDTTLVPARERYHKRLAEIKQAMKKIVDEAVREARRKASEFQAVELKAAREEFLAGLNVAIKRAVDQGALELATELTTERESLVGHAIPSSEIGRNDFAETGIYECVLGVYGQFGRPSNYPVVNLTVPDKNLWSEKIQLKLRGRIDFTEIKYEGTAKIIIPEDGTYTVRIPNRGTAFILNGNSLSAGDVQLKLGVYNVRIVTGTHGQPFLPESFVHVVRQGSDQKIPLVNSGAAIQRFLSSKVDGKPVTEVSGFRPQSVAQAAIDLSLNSLKDE